MYTMGRSMWFYSMVGKHDYHHFLFRQANDMGCVMLVVVEKFGYFTAKKSEWGYSLIVLKWREGGVGADIDFIKQIWYGAGSFSVIMKFIITFFPANSVFHSTAVPGLLHSIFFIQHQLHHTMSFNFVTI